MAPLRRYRRPPRSCRRGQPHSHALLPASLRPRAVLSRQPDTDQPTTDGGSVHPGVSREDICLAYEEILVKEEGMYPNPKIFIKIIHGLGKQGE